MQRDFTLTKYVELCEAIVDHGFESLSVEDYLRGLHPDRFVILRHDVDRYPLRALSMAEVEWALGLRSTYYFRSVDGVFQPNVIRAVADMGHEVGYHYEVLSRARGNRVRALQLFEEDLERFRQVVDVYTVCMHGSVFAPWRDYDLWKEHSLADYGLLGEPYLDIDYEDVLYFTDTGRRWDGDRYSVKDRVNCDRPGVRCTDDIIRLIRCENVRRLCVLSHPNRWVDKISPWLGELFGQQTKNIGKLFLRGYRRVVGFK